MPPSSDTQRPDTSENPAAALGPQPWPWSAITDAILRYAVAWQQLQAAQTAGQRDAALRLQYDLRDAVDDYHRVREQLADLWLMGFRAALELNPYAVGVLLGRLPVPDLAADAIRELEDRVEQVEDAVLKMEGVYS